MQAQCRLVFAGCRDTAATRPPAHPNSAVTCNSPPLLQVATLVQADWLFLLTDVPNLFTANPNVDPDAQPIYEVFDLSKLNVSDACCCSCHRHNLHLTAAMHVLSSQLGGSQTAALTNHQLAIHDTPRAPSSLPPGGHQHQGHAVGHRRHGHQADRGTHRHRRRLPHGHLQVGGAWCQQGRYGMLCDASASS